MKTIRMIASLLTAGPLLGLIGVITGLAQAHQGIVANQDVTVQLKVTIAHGLSIALYSALFGISAFVVGVVAHAVIANKTQSYITSVWRLIFSMSIVLTFLSFPFGAVLAAITLILLFTLDTFKRMRASNMAIDVAR